MPRALLNEIASLAEELTRHVKDLEDLSNGRRIVTELLEKIDNALYWECPNCGARLPRSVEFCPCRLPPLW